MKIFIFGSSLTSCYWNGAATYYRGIYRNLAPSITKSPLRNRTFTKATEPRLPGD